MNDRNFAALVCAGGIVSMTLTFFHPVMWAPTAACIGAAALISAWHLGRSGEREPVPVLVALAWLAATLLVAATNGIVSDGYNSAQIGFLAMGLVFGYAVATTRAPTWIAWAPFWLLAAYFFALLALGRDPADAFTRNSRNYVSVIMLALYVSAVLMSKPERVQRLHVVAAVVVVVLAVWGTGRAGILWSLMLTGLLVGNMLLRTRVGVVRGTVIVLALAATAITLYFGADVLISQGIFGRLEQRGIQDTSRLAMIFAYFKDIEGMEIWLGRNYYDDLYLARHGFNLHNSWLSAWAHLGVPYFIFLVLTVMFAVYRFRRDPVLSFALLALALRAITDTQVLAAKYDYIFIAAAITLLRRASPIEAPRPSGRSPRPAVSDAPGTSSSSHPAPARY